MSVADWYMQKAKQCARLGSETTDPSLRAKYEDEARFWRKTAEKLAKKDRAEGLPP
jgi:hypothetical protein